MGFDFVQCLVVEVFGFQVGGQGVGWQWVVLLFEQVGRGWYLVDCIVGLQEQGVVDDGLWFGWGFYLEMVGCNEVYGVVYWLWCVQYFQFGVEVVQGGEMLVGVQYCLCWIGGGYWGFGVCWCWCVIVGSQQQVGQQEQGR